MNEENKRMAAFVIEKMAKSNSFSICDVNDAGKLLGITPSGDAYNKLHTLHCVAWGEIPEDIMAKVPGWINEALGGRRLSIIDIPVLHEGNADVVSIEDYSTPFKRIADKQ